MATNSLDFSALSRLGALLGFGDSGTDGNMTVPTAYNTSSAWTPPATATSTPSTTQAGTGLGMNVGTGQLALGGLSALASLWGSSTQNKLAKDQFNFQKDFATTNLANQTKSYNTALEDRLTTRGAVEGRSAQYTADEIARRRLNG